MDSNNQFSSNTTSESSTPIMTTNLTILTGNAMNTYLKKHKLDLTLLPNKKMIKLSDLTFTGTNRSPIISTKTEDLFDLKPVIQSSKPEQELINQSVEQSEEEDEEIEDEDDDEEIEDEDYETETDNETIKENSNSNSNSFLNEKSNETISKTNQKKRKKREPSLKLQQRLSNEDLELIVNSVRSRQAMIYIADVKKDNYVDKILRVKLNQVKLSNGKTEALLKKSMFSKELYTLFETFTNSLCGQEQLVDENGNLKPTLTCLVYECGFKSCSEAEIMRHIKRHLAQDGYTCPTCSHQFASMTNLQRHLRIHTGEIGKEVKCSLCDYKASTITHVKRHMAHKHLERTLPCPHCSFMGATNAELKIHMARKHLELTGKNPLFLPKYLRKDYQCNICKEQYNDFKEYQTHMYEHTSSSNRFQCNECPYNCKNYSKLKRHMLYHSGARNYACDLCGNKFFQMEHLKRHMQSIHNITTNNTSNTNIQSQTNKQQTKLKNKTSKLNDQPHLRQIQSPLPLLPEQSHQQQQIQEQPELKAYECKVTSRCLYKCQQCDYLTTKLYSLNEHLIEKHSTSSHTNISQLVSQEIQFDTSNLENQNVNDYDNDDNNDNDEVSLVDDILNELTSIRVYSCSFCMFSTEKKRNLKQHLNDNHSSLASAPILLSNDSVLVQPNTKFKCGTCILCLNNINEYISHMNEKHKIQVFLLDSHVDTTMISNTQIGIKTSSEKPVEITLNKSLENEVKTVVKKTTQVAIKTKIKQVKKVKTPNRRPPSRLTSSAQLYGQTTTVRINPLIFKQQQNSQPFQLNFTKHKQSFSQKKQPNLVNQSSILINSNINSSNSNNFVDFRQQNDNLAQNHNHNLLDFTK